MARVVIIGPAHPLRGGLATFDHRLAQAFEEAGHTCNIVSFSLQYPGFLFPGTTQFSTDPPPPGISIRSLINSVNPLNWISVGNTLRKEKPDLVVVRYWLPFMGPALGTLLRRVKKNGHTRVVCIADNIIPHEKRPGDTAFTRYFVKPVDAFVTMSEKVLNDLRTFTRTKPATLVNHPLYDNFGSAISMQEARERLGIPQHKFVFLFFGFIRKYKGLDLLMQAMQVLKQKLAPEQMPLLLVAGEFYEDKAPYDTLVQQLGIEENLMLRTDFIPDSEVKYFLCAANGLVQPYRQATQSGVTPLAYHFEIPMVVTNVGGLPALVPHGEVGIVAEPDPAAIAAGLEAFMQLGTAHFLPHLREAKKAYSWEKLVHALLQL